MTDPVNVFEEKIEVPWEVEEFRQKLASDVIPKIKAGSKVDLEARLSESPEIRQKLATEVKATLTKAGATDPQVRILSAYKQGYLWLTEQVIPSLKGKGVKSVRIQVAKVQPDLSRNTSSTKSRALGHELYPVTAFYARPRGGVGRLPSGTGQRAQGYLHARRARRRGQGGAARHLHAQDGGTRVSRQVPRLVARHGHHGLALGVGRRRIRHRHAHRHGSGTLLGAVSQQILPRIYDNVMKITENKPLPDKQPFHRDLDVEVWMSEPDFRIGLDEEQISSLESLHEDLYFVTLDFFDALGRTTVKRRLAAPGKIFPIIHPSREGQAGTVRVLYAGNASLGAEAGAVLQGKGRRKTGSQHQEDREDRRHHAAGASRGGDWRLGSRSWNCRSTRKTIAKRRVRQMPGMRWKSSTPPASIAPRFPTITSAASPWASPRRKRARAECCRIRASTSRRRCIPALTNKYGEAVEGLDHLGSHHQP